MAAYYVLGLYEQKEGELLGISFARNSAETRKADLEKEYPKDRFVVVNDEEYEDLKQEFSIY